MIPAIPNGTDVWMAVPASPPLRMTIRACLNDRCEECCLPVYQCESEGGQMLRLCASHLRPSDRSLAASWSGCSYVRSASRSGWRSFLTPLEDGKPGLRDPHLLPHLFSLQKSGCYIASSFGRRRNQVHDCGRSDHRFWGRPSPSAAAQARCKTGQRQSRASGPRMPRPPARSQNHLSGAVPPRRPVASCKAVAGSRRTGRDSSGVSQVAVIEG